MSIGKLFLVAAVVTVVALGWMNSNSSSTENAMRAQLHGSINTVRQSLIDPGSAEFRDVLLHDFNGHWVTCGHVNSKNRMGGYAGHQRFIALPNGTVALERFTADFDANWHRACSNRVYG